MRLISTVLILFLSTAVFSQNQHPANVPAATGERLEDKELAASLNIPSGWIAQDQGAFVLLGHNTIPGMILLIPHQQNSLDGLRQEAQVGLVDEGINLPLDGAIQNFGTAGIMAFFKGTVEGRQARAYGISVLSPNGGGGNIIAIAEAGIFSDVYPRLVHSIANSMQFKKVDLASQKNEWVDYLKSTLLTYMDSYSSNTPGGGGYNIRKTISLCGGGYFTKSGSSLSSFGDTGGYASGNEKGAGTWDVRSSAGSDYLVLTYHDGTAEEYLLEYKEQKLYLDGSRYFRTDGSSGSEYSPDCQ